MTNRQKWSACLAGRSITPSSRFAAKPRQDFYGEVPDKWWRSFYTASALRRLLCAFVSWGQGLEGSRRARCQAERKAGLNDGRILSLAAWTGRLEAYPSFTVLKVTGRSLFLKILIESSSCPLEQECFSGDLTSVQITLDGVTLGYRCLHGQTIHGVAKTQDVVPRHSFSMSGPSDWCNGRLCGES